LAGPGLTVSSRPGKYPVRIPGEHTRDRNVLVGKLAEILCDTRPDRKVAAMFLDMAFGSPIYERLRALGHNDVFETTYSK
jgi:hypothetical protein